MKIHIISGWGNPGGSTVALYNLTKLFNKNNIESYFYTHQDWLIDKPYYKKPKELKYDQNDILIVHFLKFKQREPVKKFIFSCHEHELFRIRDMRWKIYDKIHYVSNHQKKWQKHKKIPYFICPNILDDLYCHYHKHLKKIGGIIGSIDSNKQTHISIQKAIEDNCEEILLFGNITDQDYYINCVVPLMNQSIPICYMDYCEDKQAMYDQITDVYHYSKHETWGYIKGECELTGVKYHGNDCIQNDVEYWQKDKILNTWINELEL